MATPDRGHDQPRKPTSLLRFIPRGLGAVAARAALAVSVLAGSGAPGNAQEQNSNPNPAALDRTQAGQNDGLIPKPDVQPTPLISSTVLPDNGQAQGDISKINPEEPDLALVNNPETPAQSAPNFNTIKFKDRSTWGTEKEIRAGEVLYRAIFSNRPYAETVDNEADSFSLLSSGNRNLPEGTKQVGIFIGIPENFPAASLNVGYPLVFYWNESVSKWGFSNHSGEKNTVRPMMTSGRVGEPQIARYSIDIGGAKQLLIVHVDPSGKKVLFIDSFGVGQEPKPADLEDLKTVFEKRGLRDVMKTFYQMEVAQLPPETSIKP